MTNKAREVRFEPIGESELGHLEGSAFDRTFDLLMLKVAQCNYYKDEVARLTAERDKALAESAEARRQMATMRGF